MLLPLFRKRIRKAPVSTDWIKEWGGVIQEASPDKVPPGMFLDLLNYEIDERGGLTPRTGMGLFSTKQTPDGRPIRSTFAADFDGAIRHLVATDQNVYEFVFSTDSWTSIYTIPGGTKKMLFAMLNSSFAPVVVFGNGFIDLKMWDGTTVSDCNASDAPKGRPVAFKNYLAVFDIPNAPGKCQFTYYSGDPTAWALGGVEKYIEVQGKITSLYPFVGGLLVFTESRTSIFAGDPNYPEGVQHLSETTGCWCHESVADCGGILTWLSRAGPEAWTGGGMFPSEHLGKPVREGASNIAVDIGRIAWDQTNSMCGLYIPEQNAYFLSVQLRYPVGGVPYNRLYKYDFEYQAWFPWDTEVTCMCVVPSPISGQAGKQIMISGTSRGALRYAAESEFIDREIVSANDSEYTYSARLGDWAMGSPDREKFLQAITLGTTGIIKNIPLGNRTLNMNVRGDFDRVVKSTENISVSGSGFVLDFSRLDTDTLGDPYRFFHARKPTRLRTKHIGVVFSGSGKSNAIPINSLGVEFVTGVSRKVLIGG
jgi:hypothetical protein